MADFTVKYFNSGMTGAPQISNNWGDLVTMLDACLVNGFALKAIDTLKSSKTTRLSRELRRTFNTRPRACPRRELSQPGVELVEDALAQVL